MSSLPESVSKFRERYPRIWHAFEQLGAECHEAGPLDEKTRRLVKLALAVAHRHEGAVHSAVRNALASGVSPDAMRHTALLAVTTIGWPAAFAALTWIEEALESQSGPTGV
ncbi:MAG: carboxymuconolactone decarboxylase family protein [Bryobacterales bacterium]|nr:carboxymuconolactone decarboxylase family protein [Bryobacteraceae bacterium]MDW8355276.1 carboxymuconolactone decarboxylase family protein [Bryobacterales bacterium]